MDRTLNKRKGNKEDSSDQITINGPVIRPTGSSPFAELAQPEPPLRNDIRQHPEQETLPRRSTVQQDSPVSIQRDEISISNEISSRRDVRLKTARDAIKMSLRLASTMSQMDPTQISKAIVDTVLVVLDEFKVIFYLVA